MTKVISLGFGDQTLRPRGDVDQYRTELRRQLSVQANSLPWIIAPRSGAARLSLPMFFEARSLKEGMASVVR